MRSIVSVLLVSALLIPTVSIAQTDEGPIAASARRAAMNQARPAPRGDNPYLLPSLGLIGVGGTLMVLGFLTTSGIECTSTSVSVDCGAKSNKGLIIAGAVAAGLGGFVFMRGESKRSQTELVPQWGGVAIRQRVRF
jgi:hypothetical protein